MGIPGRRFHFPRPSALEWICLAGGAVLVVRYAWMLDDAYVFFRYADNLALLGHGLVFNQGEYAEGFSSPAWVLFLSLARVAGLGYWTLVRVFGVLAFGGFWALLVACNRALSPRGAPPVDVPLVYLAFLYGASCYFTSGTESPLVLLLGAAFALYFVRRSRGLALVIACAPVVRNELVLPLGFAILWTWARERRFPWTLALSSLAIGGAWLAFRIDYYADLFPVTYYLKDGVDPAQGWRYVLDSALPYGLPVLLALGAAAFLWTRRDGEALGPERAGMLGAGLLSVAYVVKVGGDARHFRYLAFAFPLLVASVGGLAERCLARLGGRRAPPVALLLGLAVAALSFSRVPRQLTSHPILLREGQRTVDGIADAHHHRFHDGLPRLTPLGNGAEIEQRARYRAEPPGPYRGILVHSICWRFYAAHERYGLHRLGLTEPILARVAMPFDRPGHKFGLVPLAADLARVRLWWGRDGEPPAVGMHAAAVEAGVAAPWIAAGLETIELVEHKVYNHHRFLENLRLALRVTPRIQPPG